jgi:hypothetical protein
MNKRLILWKVVKGKKNKQEIFESHSRKKKISHRQNNLDVEKPRFLSHKKKERVRKGKKA